MNIIDQINKTQMPAELLIEANEAHSQLSKEDRRDKTARTIAFIKVLDELDYSDVRSQNLLPAIGFRLTALARLELAEHPEGKAWSLPGSEEGLVYAHEDLFKAAAAEPLIEMDGQVYFDRDSFYRRLLSLTEQHGNA